MAKSKKKESQITMFALVDKNYGFAFENYPVIDIDEEKKRLSRMSSNGIIVIDLDFYTKNPAIVPKKRKVLLVSPIGRDDVPVDINSKTPICIKIEAVKQWLIAKRRSKDDEKVVIVGGDILFNDLLSYCDYINIGKVFFEAENVDGYFPNIDYNKDWELISASDILRHEDKKYQMRKYKNKKSVKEDKRSVEYENV